MADKPRKNWFARAVDAVAETETNPLALAWRMLPPEARKSYASLPNAVAELSPGAAIRDTVQASGETAKAAMQGRGWDAAGGVANMLAAAAGVVPGGKLIVKGAKAANPIRAYHGSPHDFDRFDMSKIGTGEGAQAYGHGLYFAENEGVAKGYRDTLSPVLAAGKQLPEDLSIALGSYGNNVGDLLKFRREQLDRWVSSGVPDTKGIIPSLKRDIRELERLEKKPIQSAGKMYEVNIHADPAKFLDWDKPLSAQSAPVQSALRAVAEAAPSPTKGPAIRNRAAIIGGDGSVPGDVLYNNIGGFSRPAETSAILRDAGIPGIKYLDGGSRSAGTGSSNYVAFDDKLIEILRKYGLLPVAAGGAAVAANPLSTGESEAY